MPTQCIQISKNNDHVCWVSQCQRCTAAVFVPNLKVARTACCLYTIESVNVDSSCEGGTSCLTSRQQHVLLLHQGCHLQSCRYGQMYRMCANVMVF